jgi:hypothetical protein
VLNELRHWESDFPIGGGKRRCLSSNVIRG